MVRLSSCNTELLTTVITEVNRLHEEPYFAQEPDSAPTPVAEAPRYRFVSDLEAAEIVQLYETGITAVEVGEKVGRSPRTVTDVLRRHGVEIRRRYGGTDADIAEMAHLYSTGESIRKIAKRLGVSQSTVGKYLERAGVPMRSKSEAAELRTS